MSYTVVRTNDSLRWLHFSIGGLPGTYKKYNFTNLENVALTGYLLFFEKEVHDEINV